MAPLFFQHPQPDPPGLILGAIEAARQRLQPPRPARAPLPCAVRRMPLGR